MSDPPPNAFAPNTPLTVGSHLAKIIKYISSGGFAHVYTCTIDPPYHGQTVACLKRVKVPNKLELNLLRQEVDAMKRLKGNKPIVSYIDSHALRLEVANSPIQQYEVCVLMEYCPRKGLIDLMNTRLQHKLTEPEILVIMRDITTAVAMCHHLLPPLIHRDIKIENVLIDAEGNYKLCDFGSAVGYISAPQTSQEMLTVRDDIMQHTTPQYRCPEMIDLSRRFPIDDKLDVWALGCLLYKLCYYITPFERPNQALLADLEKLICHADLALKIPPNQPGLTFSTRLKNIITVSLREDPRKRPNAVQLLAEICSMMGQPVPDVIPYTTKVEAHKPHKHSHHIQSSHSLNAQGHSQTLNSYTQGVPSVQVTHVNNTIVPPKVKTPVEATSNSYNYKSPQPARKDPFSTIDKSKFLNKRPQLTYGSVTGRGGAQSNTLKDYVQQQIVESTHDVKAMRQSEELNRDTLDFLRSRQEELQSRQNTGGSMKSLTLGFLRKISTGGVSANGTGDSFRKNSVNSLKQILTGGGSSRKVSEEVPLQATQSTTSHSKSNSDFPDRKMSIKKRMSMLVKSSIEAPLKTALGYGKYTDEKAISDIEAINSPGFSSNSDLEQEFKNGPKVPQILRTIARTPPVEEKSRHKPTTKTIPIKKVIDVKKRLSVQVPGKKAPPPIPKKPEFLKVKAAENRRLSTGNELSIPDIDDLEKQFSKRFPSRVL